MPRASRGASAVPELPEVETTARGIAPHLVGRRIQAMTVRERRLRWPIPPGIEAAVAGQRILRVDRRAKYLVIALKRGHLVIHLGMSGSLRIVMGGTPPEKHDHYDLTIDDHVLRYRDPRRFGMCDYTEAPPETHWLIADLGPEPFDPGFTGAYLHTRSRGRRAPVKTFLMDAHIVTGVGNIYANEALFRARIRPTRPAGSVSLVRYEALAGHVVDVLKEAIAAGGTTLRDFVSETGRPGYFRARLDVYGRAGQPCPCGRGPVRQKVVGQRATYYCACQR